MKNGGVSNLFSLAVSISPSLSLSLYQSLFACLVLFGMQSREQMWTPPSHSFFPDAPIHMCFQWEEEGTHGAEEEREWTANVGPTTS